MKQTKHYQLNQWEKEDRILMEDFNGDNAKVDAALAAEQAARLAAVQAEATAREGLGEELRAQLRTAGDAVLIAGGTVDTGGKSALDVAVSGYALSNYSLVVVQARLPERTMGYLKVNGGGSHIQGGDLSFTAGAVCPIDSALSVTLLWPVCRSSLAEVRLLALSDRLYFGKADVRCGDVRTISLCAVADNAALPVGSSLSVWGIK